MISFDEFFDQALIAGTGRRKDGSRQIPAFVPSGKMEDGLFNATIKALARNRFNLLDIRGAQGCDKALNEFRPGWPRFSDRPLSEQYATKLSDAERLLLIVCGGESLPRFWRNLRTSSSLYTGAVFPPFLTLATTCIIVPDNACVCVVIRGSDYINLSEGCVGPTYEYMTHTSSWLG